MEYQETINALNGPLTPDSSDNDQKEPKTAVGAKSEQLVNKHEPSDTEEKKPKIRPGPLSKKKKEEKELYFKTVVEPVEEDINLSPKKKPSMSKEGDTPSSRKRKDASDEDEIISPKRTKQGPCECCGSWCALYANKSPQICSRCEFWSHPYFLPENLCCSRGKSDCFFCRQIDLKTDVKALTYKNEEDLSSIPDNNPSNAHEYVKEMPAGNYKNWTFYWNMVVQKRQDSAPLNVKLGDCVFIKHIKGSGEDLLRVSYLIRDKNRVPWISGYHIIDPKHPEIKDKGRFVTEAERKVFPNYKFTNENANGWAPVRSVTGFACCLYRDDFQKYTPKMFKKLETFPLIYDYDWSPDVPRSSVRYKKLLKADYPACKKFMNRRQLKGPSVTSETISQSLTTKESKDDASEAGSTSSSSSAATKPGPKSVKQNFILE